MSRVQLSINVSDFGAAVAFYSRLFGAVPAKLRPGYANFALDDPPLKLVLNWPGNGPGGTINHLGVEVASTGTSNRRRPGSPLRAWPPSPSPAPHVAMRCRTRCECANPTGWPGSTTPSWSTSRRHDPAPAAASAPAGGR
jgi:catechol 2,3-dioxygenase-like lactoylglutathione lyase family enzyme